MPSIIFGLWPLAGITTVGVTEADAESTMLAAIESGITHFDTAFSYGYNGESDRLLGRFIKHDRDRFQITGKVGQRWTADRKRIIDGTKATLSADAEESLRRIGIEQFDLLMLHSPDPNVPIEHSAEAIADLQRRGLCRQIGVCNIDSDRRRKFASVAGCDAIQCPLNMMQQGNLDELIPSCHRDGCDVQVYWALMKGLLAGKIARDHEFAAGDSRPNYPIFQGEARKRTHDALDKLQSIADDSGITIAQLVIGWTISQPGVTAALVGARRPEQICETAAAHPLDQEMVADIDQVLAAI